MKLLYPRLCAASCTAKSFYSRTYPTRKSIRCLSCATLLPFRYNRAYTALSAYVLYHSEPGAFQRACVCPSSSKTVGKFRTVVPLDALHTRFEISQHIRQKCC